MNVFKVAVLVGSVLWLSACGTGPHIESDLGIEDAPDWVNEGTRSLSDDEGRLFHGVGSAPAIGDLSLQKETADNRARAEVARILSSFIRVATRDYQEAGPGGLAQDVSRQIENLSQVRLTGVRIVGRWRDEQTRSVWSVAELNLEQVDEIMSTLEGMDPGFQRYFATSGVDLFDRFSGTGSE